MRKNVESYIHLIHLSLLQLTQEFKNKTGKTVIFSYGGDGKLLSTLADAVRYNSEHIIYPIRNYGNCKLHTFDEIFNNITKDNFKYLKEKIEKDSQVIPLLDIKSNVLNDWAASEFVIKNSNPTQCLRLNISVNNKPVYKNAICDGIIVSTDLIGSHGYFKSITRTTFKTGIGFAFINPTYGLTNCILNNDDKITIQIVRDTELVACLDTFHTIYKFEKNSKIIVQKNKNCKPLIVGYDDFMCYKCRMNRNSTERINDYYI